jgi:hypothetical protein
MNRIGFGLMVGLTVLFGTASTRVLGQEEVVILGDSPAQQQYFRTYWEQLRNIGGAAAPEQQLSQPPVRNSRLRSQLLQKNLRVRDLRLERIIKLNGSSELMGILTNRNRDPVTVLSVNYQIFDAFGELVQTGSATPEPSTIGPGQSVTFSRTLWTVPVDGEYKIQLAKPAFTLAETDDTNN